MSANANGHPPRKHTTWLWEGEVLQSKTAGSVADLMGKDRHLLTDPSQSTENNSDLETIFVRTAAIFNAREGRGFDPHEALNNIHKAQRALQTMEASIAALPDVLKLQMNVQWKGEDHSHNTRDFCERLKHILTRTEKSCVRRASADPNRRGRKPNYSARRISDVAARVYYDCTGELPTATFDDEHNPTSRFALFLEVIFDELSVDGVPITYASQSVNELASRE